MDVTRPGAAVQCSVRGGASHVYSGLLILYEPTRFILYTAPNPDSCSKLKLRWLFIAQHISPPAVPNGHPTLTRVTPHPHQYPGVSLVRAARLAKAMDNMITAAQKAGDTDSAFIFSHIFGIIVVFQMILLLSVCIKRFHILDSHILTYRTGRSKCLIHYSFHFHIFRQSSKLKQKICCKSFMKYTYLRICVCTRGTSPEPGLPTSPRHRHRARRGRRFQDTGHRAEGHSRAPPAATATSGPDVMDQAHRQLSIRR